MNVEKLKFILDYGAISKERFSLGLLYVFYFNPVYQQEPVPELNLESLVDSAHRAIQSQLLNNLNSEKPQ